MFAYARMRVRGWKKCVDRNLAAFSDLGLENGARSNLSHE